ncbi:LOW QUALITY PROTEIN: sprouty-related, EVH1 domain-containing protein 3-like [Sinocyclocheilus rhinocerous]|uniref:LOW QUALITY PROTEIN: sprouty-related, EVH1 domain-containing protein 3-like n=1 Tax=Sinocyclocheilus rhinocerous TaxID=307959 RepID=UPI0007B791AB|nr:PREDICTED: LOW QUALITY PROTEIN: sprouty-related, EVH1 domain-containing protein 3-like [Sinocyclocheilus rhinocerous]
MEGDVRVRAVVMTRDDSSGGWVPLGGGGLSHVIICKGRSSEGRGRREYVIRGERLRDRAPVLECAIQKGLVYNKVNPIFHHWRVEERKFGLTFQSPADAISFERGLQSVLEKLDRGSDSPSSSTPEEGDTEDDGQASHTGSESSSNSRKEMLPKPITIVTSESSSTCFVRSTEEFAYGTGHACTTQTPAQIHTRPAQHQLTQVTAILNPPAPPPPGTHGYEDYRRAGATRTKVGGLTGGVVVGGGQDKSELCVVRFEKELAGVGTTGCEVTVMLDTKGSQLNSSPTCMPNAMPGVPSASGSPQETGKGSPSPCCIQSNQTRQV